jgi:hypothetical protein
MTRRCHDALRVGALIGALCLVSFFATPAAGQPTQGMSQVVQQDGLLRRGDSGAAVRQLQAALNDHGAQLTVDGDFGPATERAVEAFQRRHGLSPDGIVGRQTAERLDRAPSVAGAATVLGRGSGSSQADSSPRERPTDNTSLADARRDGLAWARAARATGRHQLLIVYEGQFSHSYSFARRIYTYQRRLRAGHTQARPPRVTAMSFVGKQLIAPNLARFPDVELLFMPETSEGHDGSVAAEVATAWHEVHGAQARIDVIGMSFGGYAALRLCRKLEARGVPVRNLFTLDARSWTQNYKHFVRPSNVGSHHNYLQRGFMPGGTIRGADINRLLKGVGHFRLPADRRVVAHFRAFMSN